MSQIKTFALKIMLLNLTVIICSVGERKEKKKKTTAHMNYKPLKMFFLPFSRAMIRVWKHDLT